MLQVAEQTTHGVVFSIDEEEQSSLFIVSPLREYGLTLTFVLSLDGRGYSSSHGGRELEGGGSSVWSLPHIHVHVSERQTNGPLGQRLLIHK
jgi:hypothetical protein